jgi:DNA-binding beta-propeller fold protein YncE
MKIRAGRCGRFFFAVAAALAAVFAGVSGPLFALCGPFTDVTDAVFCPFVLEIFYLGITTGTTATTYDPTGTVNRLQMAAFLSRTVDSALKRGGRRASLNQFAKGEPYAGLGLTTVGANPQFVKSDGVDVWVANTDSATVSRVRGSDGRLLETWTGAGSVLGVRPAMGKVVLTGMGTPGKLFRIDPSQPAGAVTTVATNLNDPGDIAFDGARFWVPTNASVSIVTPSASLPWTVTTVTAGFSQPAGAIVYDGTNMWVADDGAGTLLKLSSAGAVLQTVTVGQYTVSLLFDGSNIWAARLNDTSRALHVVRASTGAILKTITFPFFLPSGLAFDGERILMTSYGTDNVVLFKAADASTLGAFLLTSPGGPTGPLEACSDGANFWITLNTTGQLARF